jgi:hypothetical protein
MHMLHCISEYKITNYRTNFKKQGPWEPCRPHVQEIPCLSLNLKVIHSGIYNSQSLDMTVTQMNTLHTLMYPYYSKSTLILSPLLETDLKLELCGWQRTKSGSSCVVWRADSLRNSAIRKTAWLAPNCALRVLPFRHQPQVTTWRNTAAVRPEARPIPTTVFQNSHVNFLLSHQTLWIKAKVQAYSRRWSTALTVQSAELLNVKSGGAYSYHCAWRG